MLRYADDGENTILVYHTFEQPEKLTIPLKGKWKAEKSLYDAQLKVSDVIEIDEAKRMLWKCYSIEKM